MYCCTVLYTVFSVLRAGFIFVADTGAQQQSAYKKKDILQLHGCVSWKAFHEIMPNTQMRTTKELPSADKQTAAGILGRVCREEHSETWAVPVLYTCWRYRLRAATSSLPFGKQNSAGQIYKSAVKIAPVS